MHPTRECLTLQPSSGGLTWREFRWSNFCERVQSRWIADIGSMTPYDTTWPVVNWSTDLSTSHFQAPVSASRPPTSMLNDKNVNASIFQDEMNHPSLQFLSLTTHHVWGPLVSACGENAADREARFIWLPLRLHKAMLWTFVCRSLKEKCRTNLTDHFGHSVPEWKPKNGQLSKDSFQIKDISLTQLHIRRVPGGIRKAVTVTPWVAKLGWTLTSLPFKLYIYIFDHTEVSDQLAVHSILLGVPLVRRLNTNNQERENDPVMQRSNEKWTGWNHKGVQGRNVIKITLELS